VNIEQLLLQNYQQNVAQKKIAVIQQKLTSFVWKFRPNNVLGGHFLSGHSVYQLLTARWNARNTCDQLHFQSAFILLT